jgi:hypothetical protein
VRTRVYTKFEAFQRFAEKYTAARWQKSEVSAARDAPAQGPSIAHHDPELHMILLM